MVADAHVLWDVIEKHLDEAGFLWTQWEQALVAPHLKLGQVARGVEERLNAHLEGLVVAGPGAAERLLDPALEQGEPGLVAAAASALLEIDEDRAFELLRGALVTVEGDSRAALVRALCLSQRPKLEQRWGVLLDSPHATLRSAALELLAFKGIDIGPRLRPFLMEEEPTVVAAALRAAGASGQPVRAKVEQGYDAAAVGVRDAALETGLRLGYRSAYATCQRLAQSANPDGRFALIALAIGGEPADVERLEAALTIPALRRAALFALGFAGRIRSVEKCLECMEDPKLARLAGEAVSSITGIAIEGDLCGDEPSEPEGEEEASSELLHLPENQLPLPEPAAVRAAWDRAAGKFDPAVRYLGGKPFTLEGLLEAFLAAPMRRRHVLDLELTIRSRGTYRIQSHDWAAEQLRQQRLRKLMARPDAALPFGRLLQA